MDEARRVPAERFVSGIAAASTNLVLGYAQPTCFRLLGHGG